MPGATLGTVETMLFNGYPRAHHGNFGTHEPWGFMLWDSREIALMRAHVLTCTSQDHGLHTIQTPEGSAVTLKCLKSQEAHSYPHVEPHIEAARLFSTVCKNTPIHIIWGSRNDFKCVISFWIRYDLSGFMFIQSCIHPRIVERRIRGSQSSFCCKSRRRWSYGELLFFSNEMNIDRYAVYRLFRRNRIHFQTPYVWL